MLRLAVIECDTAPNGNPVGLNFDVNTDGWVGIYAGGNQGNGCVKYDYEDDAGTWENYKVMEESESSTVVRYGPL